MILVLAGTRDGRELAAELAGAGYRVITSVVTSYGRLLAGDTLSVTTGPMDASGLMAFIRYKGIKLVVDATHPYAAEISRNAMMVCGQLGIVYLRYERPPAKLPDYEYLHIVSDASAAARTAAKLGRVIFLTTGTRTLASFKTEPLLRDCRLIARVLPDTKVLAECFTLGFTPGDLVAMQGPFSHQLNVALFSEFNSEVVVTKNSGQIGGSDSKFSAAMELGLQLIVIDRPPMSYQNIVYSYQDIKAYIEEVLA